MCGCPWLWWVSFGDFSRPAVVSGLWFLKKGWQVFACLQPCWLKWLMGSRASPLFLCRKHSHQGARDKSVFVLTTAENRRPWHPSRSIATCIGSYRQCSVCLQYVTRDFNPSCKHTQTHSPMSTPTLTGVSMGLNVEMWMLYLTP